ncbi:hypothetical protein RCL1_002259 [Eukaryota sp. TZLM3-RCL]
MSRFSLSVRKELESVTETLHQPLVGFEGFIVLAFLLLGFSFLLLAWSSWMNTGTLINLFWVRLLFNKLGLGILIYIVSILLTYLTFYVQLLKVKGYFSHQFHFFFRLSIAVSLFASLIVPSFLIAKTDMSPMVCGLCMCFIASLFLKSYSFIRVCRRLCVEHVKDEKDQPLYPSVISFTNFTFFLLSPTFVYNPFVTRSTTRSYPFIVKLLVQFSLACGAAYFVVLQFMQPILDNLTDVDVAKFCYSFLQLMIPMITVWLLGFFAIFHCGMNIFAEILMLEERNFYGFWWNATTLEDFWREWNVLVHSWLKTHVYQETRRFLKLNKVNASFLTFFVSALFHEFIMAWSFRMIRPYFFFAMVLQSFAMKVSKKIGNRIPVLGNVLCWMNLIIGQPLITLAYFTEYYRKQTRLLTTLV